uniref:Uncharacterized protein LOC114331891 n=1 Tax=Diabrotica virgifera virgifera TaxID=50390 RepID=A0A6P7FWX2_DIAVI
MSSNKVTWEDFVKIVEDIAQEVGRQSRRVLKKKVPKSKDIQEEVTTQLIKSYNKFTHLTKKNWEALSDKQRESCNKYFGKIRDKVIRSFQAVNVRTVVPNSIHQPIDEEVEEEQSDEEVEEGKSDEELEEEIINDEIEEEYKTTSTVKRLLIIPPLG